MDSPDISSSGLKNHGAEESYEVVNVDDESGHINRETVTESLISSSRPDMDDRSSLLSSVIDMSRVHYNPSRILFEGQLKEHPLETIEMYERNISSQLGGEQDLESKFILTNFKKTAESKFMSIKYNDLENVSNHCFPDINNELPLHNKEVWGIPRCIAILPFKYIAIGTSRATVIVFKYDLTSLQKLGGAKEEEYGDVMAVDMASRDEGLIAGYHNGTIVIWSTLKNERIKTIKSPDKLPILSVKFLRDSKNFFVASTTKGAVYQYKLSTSFLSGDAEKKEVPIMDTLRKRLQKEILENPAKDLLPEGFFNIELLPKELTRDHLLTRYQVAALCSMKRVILVTLEPVFCIFYISERPDGISDNIIPCVSWGHGLIPGKGASRHPLLALSWGRDLHLYEVEDVDNADEKAVRRVGYFYSQKKISHMEWISDNNIFIYDNTKEMKVLHSGSLRSAASLNSDAPFDYSQAIIDKQIVPFGLRGQQYHDKVRVNQESRPVFYYVNTIKGLRPLRRMFVMCEHQLIVAKHFEWSESLEEQASKGEWMTALSLCIAFFKGTVKKFAGLPNNTEERKKLLQATSSALAKQYIEKSSNMRDSEAWTTLILTTIDFLVSVENFKCLFVDVKAMFEGLKLKETFLQCLEPFILKDRITSIPKEAFRDIIKFYLRQNKLDVIQYLILNLSMEHLNLDYTITVCMEYSLLTALMYLCPQKDGAEGPDFITPIAKAMSTYQRGFNFEERTRRDHGIRFLWFVHMTVNGRIFPTGMIPEDVWEQKVVPGVIVLIFQETSMDLMLKAEKYTAFEILRQFFHPTIADVIKAQREPLLDCLYSRREKESLSELQTTILSFRDMIKNVTIAEMLGIVYFCAKKERQYEDCLLYMFADLVVLYDYTLPDKVLEECALYVIQNPRPIAPWEANRLRMFEMGEDDGGETQEAHDHREVLALELIKRMYDINELQINRFDNYARQQVFADIRVYLLEISLEFRKAFELYLGENKDYDKCKVFKWLDHMIPILKSSRPQDFLALKDVVISNLRELVRIDSEKTRKIVVGLDKNLEITAIYHLENIPDLQLEYLKRILAKRDEGAEVQDNLLKLHIGLLCQLHPKEVLNEVKSYDYPLEDCMDICKRYEIKDAYAFFLEKNGNTFEALNNLLEVFMDSIQKKYRKVKERRSFKIGLLLEKFQAVREICLRYSKLGDHDSERNWFNFLDCLLEGYDRYITNNPDLGEIEADDDMKDAYDDFHKAYSECVSYLFDDLSKHVLVESFMGKLQTYRHLKLDELKASILEILQTYHHESNILAGCASLLKGDISENVADVYNVASGGIRNESIVLNERRRIRESVMFNCGHVFPRQYVESKICPICANAEDIKVKYLLRHIRRGGVMGPRVSRGIPNPTTYNSSSTNPTNTSSTDDSAKDQFVNDKEKVANALNNNNNNPQQKPNDMREKLKVFHKLKQYEESKTGKAKDWDEFLGKQW